RELSGAMVQRAIAALVDYEFGPPELHLMGKGKTVFQRMNSRIAMVSPMLIRSHRFIHGGVSLGIIASWSLSTWWIFLPFSFSISASPAQEVACCPSPGSTLQTSEGRFLPSPGVPRIC